MFDSYSLMFMVCVEYLQAVDELKVESCQYFVLMTNYFLFNTESNESF